MNKISSIKSVVIVLNFRAHYCVALELPFTPGGGAPRVVHICETPVAHRQQLYIPKSRQW